MISIFQAQLSARTQLTHNVVLFTFKPVAHSFEFQAGQYVILHIPQADGHPARRLYSMASSEKQTDQFQLIVELIENGVASTHLMAMKIGDTVTAQGPAGMFVLPPQHSDTVFFATGTGIAPIRSMILKLLAEEFEKKIILFWGFPHYDDIYLLDEFCALNAKHPNFMFYNCMSRETDITVVPNKDQQKFHDFGHINDAFEKIYGQNALDFHYYLCGGPKVIDSLKEYLASKTVPKEQVHLEKFTA